ncbi:helix-turn-helix domain-containing protein [Asticcacaulis sp. YBE204]|uniref:helix-turn-helix domain-containing protein n=1 Tax=Asticcacaulis sp. YBE204 TaxID=1282363 RepID=UPI0003C3D7E2|nr:helix-turn-helix domain-containing protein [Asticcacaulis sp. YBE204]ESQ81190.1 hypothetical protein AEYBE204_02320 [Asticcacaulis sp. YBE204]
MDTLSQTEKLAYRIEEAVQATGLGRSFLYEAMKSGELPAFKIGGRRLIGRDELVAFIDRHRAASQR